MDATKIRLPIKVVIPQERDYFRPSHGGGDPKEFVDVTTEVRGSLVAQLERVNNYFNPMFQKFPRTPAVARVTLRKQALAKSYRPDNLLNTNTCPIIGVEGFGELLVSVQPQSLELLADNVRTVNTKTGIADISTIQSIVPYTTSDVLGSEGVNALKDEMKNSRHPVKLRLFQHYNTILNDRVLHSFREQIEELNMPFPEEVNYYPGMKIFRVEEIWEDLLNPLVQFIGTQRLSVFPRYQVLRTESTPLREALDSDFPPPDEKYDYPLVGVIDSGIDPNNKMLSKWVVAREDLVKKSQKNFDHGSFVGGLLIHSRRLNGNDPRFPNTSAKIIDIVAMPGNGELAEDELLKRLRHALEKFPDVRVWNLSLASSTICTTSSFSDLAIALDNLQDEFGVTFILAAGNYDKAPLRGWPPEDLGEADRICSPADSVRGVSIGSIAHVSKHNSCVPMEQPSPFSRRGPGPVYLPKPELTHYGGNCDVNGNYLQTGVISFDSKGNIAEGIGTSFSTPLVASLMANVDNALSEKPSLNLMKALVIHSARLSSTGLITTDDLKYRGFGVPQSLGPILTCEPWYATLIFETELFPGLAFHKTQFPMPQCLRGPKGTIRGEVLVTLVYNPPLDPNFGSEYCRRNVDVSLGTYDAGKHVKQVPPEPKDLKERYEKNLIEHGFKWSPIKVYRREMKRVKSDQWRLLVKLLNRKNFFSEKPQKIALIITLLDPEKRQPVYDEIMRWMNREGWITTDLRIKDRIQIRT